METQFSTTTSIASTAVDHCLDVLDSIEHEAEWWKTVAPIATAAFEFWREFLDLRVGVTDTPIKNDAAATALFRCIIRAISWVESKHGRDTLHPSLSAKDPMQCGKDAYWKSLTALRGNTDRIIRNPALKKKNYFLKDLPAAIETETGFPADAKLSKLIDPKQGHDDPNFNKVMSYHWAALLVIHRTNRRTGGTWRCGVLTQDRTIEGAFHYNGHGDKVYKCKIKKTLEKINCT